MGQCLGETRPRKRCLMASEQLKPVYIPPSPTVTPYDRVAGMIIAALVLVGGFVGVLMLIFLFTVDTRVTVYPPLELVDGNPNSKQTSGPLTELESPSADEMPELATAPMTPTLTTLIESASTVAANPDLLSIASSASMNRS